VTKQEVDQKIGKIGSLTQEQFEAVTDDSQTVLTLACAGSGKSRTLAYRVARIVAVNESPKSIVAFTFTDSAAEAMKRAIASALEKLNLSPANLSKMYVGTIHAYCRRFLSEGDPAYRQFTVLDENRLALFIYSRAGQLGVYNLKDARGEPKVFEAVKQTVRAWQLMHDEMLDIDAVVQADPTLGGVLKAIENALASARCIDFSQLVSRAAKVLETRAHLDVRHLLVDEYQDINPAQEKVISRIHGLGASLFAVGDDDQAIYAWRGADVTRILTFRQRYGGSGMHVLPTNFRSTEPIVAVSNEFAERTLNPERIPKSPQAYHDANPQELGVLWFDERQAEAAWVAERIQSMLGMSYHDETSGTQVPRGLTPGDFAILMRSTKTGDTPHHAAFSDALTTVGINYSLEAGNRVCSDPLVAAIIKVLELLRERTPDRSKAQQCFDADVAPIYSHADFGQFTDVLNRWGNLVHTPLSRRRRVMVQQLLQELLAALGVAREPPAPDQMRILGQFSRIIEDIETVYVSIDNETRYKEALNFLARVAPDAYEMSTDDLVARPDAVTISTVHGVKGLEFPVVFVVDVASRRFPHDKRRYDGWMPERLVDSATRRGAYCTTARDEARLFYTALTRAERFLYVTGSAMEPALKRAKKGGDFFDFLSSSSHTRIVRNPSDVSSISDRSDPQPRFSDANLPTSFSEVRNYLTCPMQYEFRHRWGFAPPINEMVGFGTTVHTIIEKLHTSCSEGAPTSEEISQMVDQTFHLPHAFRSGSQDGVGPYERARESAERMVQRYVQDHKTDFERIRTVEAPFEIQVCGAVLSGSIDLLMRESADGTPLDAELIDFKAMDIDGGSTGSLDWTALSLQVQLYARAAKEILGTPVKLGSVHMLKDGVRIVIPIDAEAQDAAIGNVEWAVSGILQRDFPMRPQADKCSHCDFHLLCAQQPKDFAVSGSPPPVRVPVSGGINGELVVPALALFDRSHERV